MTSNLDPDARNSYRLLIVAARLVQRRQDDALAPLGLTRTAAIALEGLASGPLNQEQLAAIIHVRSQTLGRVLTRLEGGGHITRPGRQRTAGNSKWNSRLPVKRPLPPRARRKSMRIRLAGTSAGKSSGRNLPSSSARSRHLRRILPSCRFRGPNSGVPAGREAAAPSSTVWTGRFLANVATPD
jgi:hypothetical protein